MDMAQNESKALKRITLENDFGAQISFTGYLEGENIDYEDLTNSLISEKIYRSEEGRTGYSIVIGRDDLRERRAYLIEQQNETCMVSNGSLTLGLDTDMLLTFMGKALEDQEESTTEDSLKHIRKQLQAVNE
jgi:hypothetical protein